MRHPSPCAADRDVCGRLNVFGCLAAGRAVPGIVRPRREAGAGRAPGDEARGTCGGPSHTRTGTDTTTSTAGPRREGPDHTTTPRRGV